MFFLKFTFYFLISFMILNIPVRNDNLFTQLNKLAAPYAKELLTSSKTLISKGIKRGKQFSAKLFVHSVHPETEDQVSNISSATQHPNFEQEEFNLKQEEEYTVEEQQLIDKLIKKAQ